MGAARWLRLPFRLHPVHHTSRCNIRLSWPARLSRVHPIDKHVGARVRMRRIMLNMSQEAIGDALGLTYQQIQKYEKGSNRISASRLRLLCTILQAPVSFFFEGAPPADGLPVPETEADRETAALNGFLATSDGVALAVAFGRIRNAKVRRAIVALVVQIVAEPVAAPSGSHWNGANSSPGPSWVCLNAWLGSYLVHPIVLRHGSTVVLPPVNTG
jgi:transcriptional regulator with XRE-family HTH domain